MIGSWSALRHGGDGGQYSVLFAQGKDGPPELLPPQSLEPEGTYEVIGTDLEFAPMITLIWCMASLAACYFIVCSMSATVRLIERLRAPQAEPEAPSRFRRALEAAEAAANAAPMLCVLFLAVQMEAILLSDGRRRPPYFTRVCMQIATVASLVQTFLTMVMPICSGSVPDVDEDTFVVQGRSWWARGLSLAVASALCVACAGLCVGVVLMQLSKDFNTQTLAIAPSVICTASLSIQFFIIYIALVGAFAIQQRPKGLRASKLVQVLRLAAQTMFFAPMLCILFVAARVRAMQVDPEIGKPQGWAICAFYVCSGALAMQTVLALVVPYLPGGDARRGTRLMKGDIEVLFTGCEYGSTGVRVALTFLQYTPIILLGGGVLVVIVSILFIESPAVQARSQYASSKAPGRTPALPPTMQCIIFLSAQFFSVYLGLWAAVAARSLIRGPQRIAGSSGSGLRAAVRTMHAASTTAKFCPMLAVLFVALRLRAQQITGDTGAPQGWAQDAMYAGTAAVFVQLVVCLVAGIVGRPEVDKIGNLSFDREASRPVLRGILVTLHGAAVLTIHASAATVCAGLVLLSPESAGAQGALLR